MITTPTHLRYVPFGLAFTLNKDGDLLCAPLREDKSYSTDIEDYQVVELDASWSDEEEDTLMIIHQTLLGF